jgi:hypothetical protein
LILLWQRLMRVACQRFNAANTRSAAVLAQNFATSTGSVPGHTEIFRNNGIEMAPPTAPVRERGPCRRMTGPPKEIGRAKERGLHALHHIHPGQICPDLLAHHRAAAVASDQVIAPDVEIVPPAQVARTRKHAIDAVFDIGDLHLREYVNLGRCCSEVEQDGFEIDLVDPVLRLGCRPPRVGTACRREAVFANWNRNARQLVARSFRARRPRHTRDAGRAAVLRGGPLPRAAAPGRYGVPAASVGKPARLARSPTGASWCCAFPLSTSRARPC